MSLWVNAAGKIVRRVNAIVECDDCPCCPVEVSVVLSGFAGYTCQVLSETISQIVDIVSGVNGGPFTVAVGLFSNGAGTIIGTRRQRVYSNNTCGGTLLTDDTTNVVLYASCDPIAIPHSVFLTVDIAGIGNAGWWTLNIEDFPGTMNLNTCFNRLVCGTITGTIP